MNTEIEAKFVNVDHDEIRHKLKDIGATLVQPMRLMRRVTIETDNLKSKNAFLRVRDEGNKVTATYKQFDELSIDDAKEIEIQVSDFESTVALFAACGLVSRSYQESKRESWDLHGTEIVLDVWPWLNPYLEIEGKSTEDVKAVARNLGLMWDDAVFGDVMAAYRVQYPHLGLHDTVASLPSFLFSDPFPAMLKSS